jgi:hypothetical protein
MADPGLSVIGRAQATSFIGKHDFAKTKLSKLAEMMMTRKAAECSAGPPLEDQTLVDQTLVDQTLLDQTLQCQQLQAELQHEPVSAAGTQPLMLVSPLKRAHQTFNRLFPNQTMKVVPMSSEQMIQGGATMLCPDCLQSEFAEVIQQRFSGNIVDGLNGKLELICFLLYATFYGFYERR